MKYTTEKVRTSTILESVVEHLHAVCTAAVSDSDRLVCA